MPTYDQHTAQAEHNRELLGSLVQRDEAVKFSDWYVTVAFYAALHYYEAMLFSAKPVIPAGGAAVEHSSDLCAVYDVHSQHRIRNLVMGSNFKQIYPPYYSLYKMSRTARYNCHTPSKYGWLRAEKLLAEVKKECNALRRQK